MRNWNEDEWIYGNTYSVLMIYITQLIFLKPGKEKMYQQFEEIVLPRMVAYGGTLLHRIRPSQTNFIDGLEETPYEIHLIAFKSENGLQQFMKDEIRLKHLHLKTESVQKATVIKGIEL